MAAPARVLVPEPPRLARFGVGRAESEPVRRHATSRVDAYEPRAGTHPIRRSFIAHSLMCTYEYPEFARGKTLARPGGASLKDWLAHAQPAQFITIPISGRSLREIERDVLVVTMRLTAFNSSAAARILGISRPTLYRKLQENGICRQPAP